MLETAVIAMLRHSCQELSGRVWGVYEYQDISKIQDSESLPCAFVIPKGERNEEDGRTSMKVKVSFDVVVMTPVNKNDFTGFGGKIDFSSIRYSILSAIRGFVVSDCFSEITYESSRPEAFLGNAYLQSLSFSVYEFVDARISTEKQASYNGDGILKFVGLTVTEGKTRKES